MDPFVRTLIDDLAAQFNRPVHRLPPTVLFGLIARALTKLGFGVQCKQRQMQVCYSIGNEPSMGYFYPCTLTNLEADGVVLANHGRVGWDQSALDMLYYLELANVPGRWRWGGTPSWEEPLAELLKHEVDGNYAFEVQRMEREIISFVEHRLLQRDTASSQEVVSDLVRL